MQMYEIVSRSYIRPEVLTIGDEDATVRVSRIRQLIRSIHEGKNDCHALCHTCTYSDGVGMRVDAVHDQFVERAFECHLRHLALLEEQFRVRRTEDRRLRGRLEVVERLRSRLRTRAARLRGADALVQRGGAGEQQGARGERLRRGEVRRGAEEPDDRGIAVVELRHRVEEVGDEPRTALHRSRRDVRGGNTT